MDCKFNTDLGLVTVNDDVIVRVAGYAALDCYGIVGMASKRGTDGLVQMMGRENLGRGLKIRSSGDKVDIDLFIIVEYGISISAVAAAIIETVKYKVEHLTGVPVGSFPGCFPFLSWPVSLYICPLKIANYIFKRNENSRYSQ